MDCDLKRGPRINQMMIRRECKKQRFNLAGKGDSEIVCKLEYAKRCVMVN
jgi:hypothetical protein